MSDQQPNNRSTVTLEMVAKHAKVSASTVSRILNGTAVVSVEKRKRVENAVAELGFIPNPIARGLAGGKTMSIGVITQYLDSPFYGAALRGIESELQAAGYSPLFVSGHWDPREEMRCILALQSRHVDGIIVLDGRLSDAELRKAAKQLPIVVTGRTLTGENIFSMQFDNALGGEMATEYLVSLGHREIAFITGDSQHQDGQERVRGFLSTLKRHGLKPAMVIHGDFSEDSGSAAVQELLNAGTRFTAVFAANDQMALGAALRLSQAGIRIPQDVSVVGFDDLLASRFFFPPLTTVHQPSAEIGGLTVTAMLRLLAGEVPDQLMPSPRLVIRSSTAPARASN